MAKTFREWDVDQRVLLSPNVMDLREGHVARFVKNLVSGIGQQLTGGRAGFGRDPEELSGRTGISTLPPGDDDGGDPLWIPSRDLVIEVDRAGLW